MAEHAVIVWVDPGRFGRRAVEELHERFELEVGSSEVGEYDGFEIAINLSEATFYFYGPNADELFQEIAPVLRGEPITANAVVTLRYGSASDHDAKVKTVRLGGKQ